MLKTLSVICNPFAALDPEGVPSGAYPFDPEHGMGARRWVGAHIDTDRTIRFKSLDNRRESVLRGKKLAYESPPRQRTRYAFDLGPQLVIDTVHYRRGMQTGDIFPATEDVARMVGLKFVPPADALDAARTKAIAEWKASYGQEPDYALWPENLRPKGHTTTERAAVAHEGSAP